MSYRVIGDVGLDRSLYGRDFIGLKMLLNMDGLYTMPRASQYKELFVYY